MRHHRLKWTLLAAACLFSPLAAPPAFAQRFLFFPSYPSGGPFMSAPLAQPYSPYTPYTNYYYSGPSYMPYVAPTPAYGVIPPPFVTEAAYIVPGASTGAVKSGPQARMRESLYPAVPYEKISTGRPGETHRVRYEVEVPFADAVVYIDGVKTKQTGLKRSYVTPPMEDDRNYSVTIKAEWVDQFQKTRQREQTFTFVAGETVRCQFKE